MEARLKAILEMDVSELQKELVKSVNELKKFEREIAKTTDTQKIGELTSKISEMKSKISQLTPAMQQAGNATAKAGAAMSMSGQSAQNFARVIQDLPFGFMGIQNNLTQLIPGIGAAGIAFSVLTAAITFSQVGLTYWSRSSKAAKDAQDSFTKSMNESVGTVAAETANLNALVLVINDTTQSTETRERALAKLKDTYKSNIDLQKIDLADGAKLTGIIDKITAALMRKAQAEVFSKMIAEEQAKAAKIQNESLEQSVEELGMAEKAWNALKATLTAGNPALLAAQLKLTNIQEALKRKYEALGKVNKNIKTYTDLLHSNTLATIQNNDAQTIGTNEVKAGKTTTNKTVNKTVGKPFDYASFDAKMKLQAQMENSDANIKPVLDKPAKGVDPAKPMGDLSYWEGLATAREALNVQMEQSNQLAEYGGQVFGQMAMAMMQGTNIGDVLIDSLKRMVAQLVAAVAQAAIFAAIMSAISPGSGSFGSLFSSQLGGGGGGGGGIGGILGRISGQNIELSNSRTSTGMGYRRGRR